MPGRAGSRIAGGDRLAGKWGAKMHSILGVPLVLEAARSGMVKCDV